MLIERLDKQIINSKNLIRTFFQVSYVYQKYITTY